MIQKEKELLLKDICARLPYYVIVNIEYNKEHGSSYRLKVCSEGDLKLNTDLLELFIQEEIYLKPYLRPMSSMTEEEKRELQSFYPGSFGSQWLNIEKGTIDIFECSSTITLYLNDSERIVDWLNKKMFDYRGLIEKDLAIEVTEENNPYKE